MSVTHVPDWMRQFARERAGGRCEFCGIHEDHSFARHEIDHVVAEKHGGPTTAENLALCCVLCNRYKGSDLASIDPDTGEKVFIYNPRTDSWNEHFRLEIGRVMPLTSVGRATVRLLRLNSEWRIVERSLLEDL